MRRWIGLFALGLGLYAALQAEGQVTTQKFIQGGTRAASLGGVSKAVVNVPIDTSNALTPFPRQETGGFLTSFFRKVGKIGMPVVGQSALPAPSSFPSTKYKNSFQPVMPK